MRYLTLVFVAFFATSCTGETNSMRGYFYDMGQPPMMLMDSDGGSGGGSDDDDNMGQSRGERAMSEAFGRSSRGEIGISAPAGSGGSRGEPGVGQSRGEQALSEAFGDRSRGPTTQPGSPDMRRIQGNEGNRLKRRKKRFVVLLLLSVSQAHLRGPILFSKE